MPHTRIRQSQEFRIIAGLYRHRRLHFPALPGIRPSPDRVRETLFNWLMPVIRGARCLDLFAGSGALGLESLSREAGEVVFVDSSREAIGAIDAHLQQLAASGGRTVVADARDYLRPPSETDAGSHPRPGGFDVVFLDPPFHGNLLMQVCGMLNTGNWLAPNARVYLEYERGLHLQLPPGWQLLRESHAGQVGYGLAKVSVGR